MRETIVESKWQLTDAENLQQAQQQIIETFQSTYHEDFEDEMMGINHKLNVEVRGLKLVENWLTGFILTPWMLGQIFMPLTETEAIEIDPDWTVTSRKDQSYVVIGPLKQFEMAGQNQKAYLNYDAVLGHYLIQPLVQLMEKFQTNDEAFAAWGEVIQFRQEHYAKAQQQLEEAQQQEEASQLDRRAFLSKWRG